MNKIILVGGGGSGKDYFRKKLQNKKFKYGLTFTTRPKRSDETDGKDYHFVTQQYFKELIAEQFFVEYDCYRSWYYGTPISEWNRADIFTMTPAGIKQIEKTVGLQHAFIIYLNPDIDVRRQRLQQRTDADDPERRLRTDATDFEDFVLYDIEIKNADF